MVNKPKAPSPVIEEIEEGDGGIVGEEQQVEVIISEATEDKIELEEKAEVEATKVCDLACAVWREKK